MILKSSDAEENDENYFIERTGTKCYIVRKYLPPKKYKRFFEILYLGVWF